MLVQFLRTSALFMSILILSIGCSKVDEVYQYIRIEESTCSFYGSDNAPRTIKIEAYPKYETEPSASWIVIGDVTDNSFSITVTDNDTNEERIGNILITAGDASARIRITQLAKGNTSPVYNTYDGYDLGAVMSPNGRYCVCVRHEMLSDENYLSYPVFSTCKPEPKPKSDRSRTNYIALKNQWLSRIKARHSFPQPAQIQSGSPLMAISSFPRYRTDGRTVLTCKVFRRTAVYGSDSVTKALVQ